MIKIKKVLNVFIGSAIIFCIYSCEDDALLTPKIQDDCPEGPSYCNLSFPNDIGNYIAYNPKRF